MLDRQVPAHELLDAGVGRAKRCLALHAELLGDHACDQIVFDAKCA